jgi:transposase
MTRVGITILGVKQRQSATPSSDAKPIASLAEFVGLRDARICALERDRDGWVITIEQPRNDRGCSVCHAFAVVKERPVVRLIDRPAFDRPVVILWRKYRLSCPNDDCSIGSWTHHDPRIASTRSSLTARAARWVAREVGKGRSVAELAAELRCGWSVVDEAMRVYGQALLDADKARVGACDAIGLDETLFVRRGQTKIRSFITTVADVRNGRVIDVIESRNFVDVAGWIDEQPDAWKRNIRFGTLDLSSTYRSVYREMLSHVMRVADPFHVVKLANAALDDVRRRVQIEQTGHRGRKDDPLYRVRKLLLRATEKLDSRAAEKRDAQLKLGDPDNEVSVAYLAKERIRDFYKTAADDARKLLDIIIEECSKKSMPPELQRLARTFTNWREEITNWLNAKVSNGPTEALNNLIKRVKRTGYGFRNFESYRIRILLYAGKPNWRILDSIVVP